jgi:hypothetical protein
MLMRALSVHIAHEIAGAARIRHSLRPLISRGRENNLHTSGAMRRESAKLFPRHCERSEAIHRAAKRMMDCFAALAMTAVAI